MARIDWSGTEDNIQRLTLEIYHNGELSDDDLTDVLTWLDLHKEVPDDDFWHRHFPNCTLVGRGSEVRSLRPSTWAPPVGVEITDDWSQSSWKTACIKRKEARLVKAALDEAEKFFQKINKPKKK